MPSVLITGASRGIGLALANAYAADGWTVHAAMRDPSADCSLSQRPDINIHALDVTDHKSIEKVARSITGPLDVVIANAGHSGRWDEEGLKKGVMDYDGWRQTMEVNLFGAFATIENFLPHVEKAKGKLVAISSVLGSIEVRAGGNYPYNSSKAALNMTMSLLAQEVAEDGIAVGALHPGWVRTDMGGTQAPLSAEESAKGLKTVIASLQPDPRLAYKDYSGATIPW